MKVINQQQIYQNYQNNNLKSQNLKNNRVGAMQNTLASDTVSFNGLFNSRNLRKVDGWVKDMIKYAPGIIDKSE